VDETSREGKAASAKATECYGHTIERIEPPNYLIFLAGCVYKFSMSCNSPFPQMNCRNLLQNLSVLNPTNIQGTMGILCPGLLQFVGTQRKRCPYTRF